MIQAKQILCPYCCSRFLPNTVHFRLVSPLQENAMAPSEPAQEEEDDIFNTVGRRRSSDKSNRMNSQDGRVLDEQLYNYYRFHMGVDDAAAKQDAMQMPFVAFDVMNNEIQYDLSEMNNFGYVTSIYYKNQHLTKRLCPNCHKDLIDGAGKYNMYLVSVIGDTNVGKSIYLAVLEAMIEKGPFNASMFFMGSKEEHDYYLGTSVELVQKRKRLAATIGKVPPLTFQLTFDNKASGQRNTILVTFCDIPGEKCRDNESLQIYGNHLKASSGLMFLIDPTRFGRVKNSIEEGADIDHMYQMDVISAINRFLVSATHYDHTNIPTAIMVTKCDTLKTIPYFQESETHRKLIEDPDWNMRHPGYVNDEVMKSVNLGVQDFFDNMDESDFTRKVADLFSKYSFFINSSLGHAFEKDYEADSTGMALKQGHISPYRITEAFYWILCQNDILPKKMSRSYRNKKTGELKVISLYYYNSEPIENVSSRIEMNKLSYGIKDSFLHGKWVREQDYFS